MHNETMGCCETREENEKKAMQISTGKKSKMTTMNVKRTMKGMKTQKDKKSAMRARSSEENEKHESREEREERQLAARIWYNEHTEPWYPFKFEI